ncbi:hypothetical protein [Geminocystis sp. NIES-3709]|uniref:hypothetical protein n=1 Tax=Geminocystis sp. NIES-3709 TaxID=1617448 RepID=UPI0005FCCB33|nr:hypothetical protein [Geminocystis sp. NIES-3709]BAQ65021.1 methyl-accepting chemotaxis protein [Geminocystis sp. NIES-3709]
MKNESNINKYQTTLKQLPLDNYRVDIKVATEIVEQQLLLNPKLSGVFVLKNNQVIGVISRRKFFEKMSKEYARDIYSKRPIKLLIESYNYDPLKIPLKTEINDAVKIALERSADFIYEPIVVTKKGEEIGMLELSILILYQAQTFSEINNKLLEQEQNLRNYADTIEIEKQKVKEYANQLEHQQADLKEANKLLKNQTKELEEKQTQLFLETQKVNNLNQRFSDVGLLLSKEGKNTFQALSESVKSMINFTEQINEIGDNFQNKFKMVNQATDLINKISKRVENLSFQAGVMVANLPSDDGRGISFNMISEEIKKLSLQIAEATASVNSIAQQLKPEIKILVNTAQENREVVKSLVRNSQGTELALNKLNNLVEKGQDNV